MLYGARITLLITLGAVLVSLVIGTILGLVAGFLGGWTDTLIMRVMDVLLAMPGFLLAIAIIAALGAGTLNVVIAVGDLLDPGVRAGGARLDALGQAAGLRAGGPRPRRRRQRHHVAAHPAEHHAAAGGPDDAAARDGDPDGVRALVPGARAAAADAGVGRDAEHRPQL